MTPERPGITLPQALLFPALLAVSALLHLWLVWTTPLALEAPRAEMAPTQTTQIFVIEESQPEPTPEPTPPTPAPEPTPAPAPEKILTATESTDSTAPPQESEPLPTPAPKPIPQPTPKARLEKKATPSQAPRTPARADNVPQPVVIRNTPPTYPEIARRNGWEGRTIVRVEVSAEGRPTAVTISRSSGYGVLDQSALRAVKSWRFQPRTIAGTPTSGTVEVPVNFSLNR